MSQSVRINHNQRRVELEVDDRIDLWTASDSQRPALSETEFSAAIHRALEHPTDYPPLSGGVVPGDAVAIVVDVELPHPVSAIAGVLQALSPLDLSRIDVVIADSATESTRAAVRESLPAGVELTIHSGKSRDDLRYLAANEAADPIYLNRRVVDADLVIPVMVARGSDPVLLNSTTSAVFPTLADHQSQVRSQLTTDDLGRLSSPRRTNSDDEATRVGWLLGLQWMVSVEVNDDGEPCAVYAGTPELMAARVSQRDHGAEPPFAAEIVVACVDGGQQQQSITNLLRAALAARAIGTSDATIVLVSDVNELGTVAGTPSDDFFDQEDDDDSESQDMQAQLPTFYNAAHHSRDLLSSLINELDSSQRYLLLSHCGDDEVESFGFGAIDNVDALARLINGHNSCIVIRNAQLASAKH
ncbi:MAG: lactate racemase domain-containing protein [Planctomycetaceae bacterium]